MADLTKATLSADSIQRTGLAALAQPLASSALLGDKLQIAPGLLNPGLIGGIDTGVLRPRPLATLAHVQPGELITATLMNAIIDRLNALAGDTGPDSMAGDVTGTTAANQIAALQGRSVQANAPAEGQLLGFANNAWRPVAAPQQATQTPTVVAAALIRKTSGTSDWIVTSVKGSMSSKDDRLPRFAFADYNPTFHNYFFRLTLQDADGKGGITTVMPFVLRMAPDFFELGFQPLSAGASFDGGLVLQIEVAAYPKLFTLPPGGIGTLPGGIGTLPGGVNVSPGVLNPGFTTPVVVNPGVINSGAPAVVSPGTPVINELQPVILSPEALAGLNFVAATPAATAPAAVNAGQPIFIIAQPGMFGTAPAAVAANNLRSMPTKKAPARKPAAKRSASKKTTPKGA